MKKSVLSFSVLMCLCLFSFSQVRQGDIQLVQKYFGAEKLALVKEYMALSPAQDSLFWTDYSAYEAERQELGKRKIMLADDYARNLLNLDDSKAIQLVEEANAIDLSFKQLQKKYFKKMSKTIGAVKAAQFYQLESYLNNVINISIQESIPFVGELEQLHDRR